MRGLTMYNNKIAEFKTEFKKGIDYIYDFLHNMDSIFEDILIDNRGRIVNLLYHDSPISEYVRLHKKWKTNLVKQIDFMEYSFNFKIDEEKFYYYNFNRTNEFIDGYRKVSSEIHQRIDIMNRLFEKVEIDNDGYILNLEFKTENGWELVPKWLGLLCCYNMDLLKEIERYRIVNSEYDISDTTLKNILKTIKDGVSMTYFSKFIDLELIKNGK